MTGFYMKRNTEIKKTFLQTFPFISMRFNILQYLVNGNMGTKGVNPSYPFISESDIEFNVLF